MGVARNRADNLHAAGVWLSKMAGMSRGSEGPPLALLVWIAGSLAGVNLLPETWDLTFSTRPRWAVAWAAAFLFAYLFLNGRETVFLYYQF